MIKIMFNSLSSETNVSLCNLSSEGLSSENSNEIVYNVKIPKIIMQTWKDKNIPDKWKSSPKSIEKYMPDWKYILLTDQDNRDFVKKYFPDFLKYYDDFPYPIMRADAIRYLWLYKFGGIYMDLDFEVMEPLDRFFVSDIDVYLVHSSNVGSYLTNSFMASKPKCQLWLSVIEAMKKPNLSWYHMGRHMQVMNVTGPIMLTHAVIKSKVVYATLPTKLFLPCSICNIGNQDITKGAALKQLEGSSWVTYDTKFYNFFLCNWKHVVVAIILLLLILILFLILRCYV